MIFDLLAYLFVFTISIFMLYLFQRAYKGVLVRGFASDRKHASGMLYCLVGCAFLLPVIAMFGLRYGIGTDYFAYEETYNRLHIASFGEYWHLHNLGGSYYYVEPGFYFLNRLFPNYRLLLWAIGILLFILFFLAVKDYFAQISFPFALFIYLSTQFTYALNGMRFAIALCLILIGYIALAQDRTNRFIIMILIASLFHQSSFICFAMLFLKRFKYKDINSIRNLVFFALIILFPILNQYLLRFAGSIPMFKRYFTVAQYSASETMSSGWKWLLHIVPVYLPLLLLCRKEIIRAKDTDTLFRICIMEVPFRMFGLFNTFYTRLARCAQITQVIFIPLVLARTKDKQKRILLYLYYIAWYVFYFAYYAIINDQGDSLPYVWIFSQ